MACCASHDMRGRVGAVAPPWLLLLICGAASAHYGQSPCQSDEVQGEVQGSAGNVCAPKCDASTYNCPMDMPSGSSAQAQCMLQDIDKVAYCGLLCQVDAQCPSGARCQQMKQMQVGLCLFPVSFADWAKQGTAKKLAIGWPSQAGGKPPASFQISKTYASLQNLKQRYSIDDGDADMLTLKELLASLAASSTPAPANSVAKLLSGGSSSSGGSQSASGGSWWNPWSHDIGKFEDYMSKGVPGIEQEVHDTVYNIEHIEDPGRASDLLRGVILFGLLYLAIGSFIKYQSHGASGMDMIPHIGFWSDYPQLVIDGIDYSKILVNMWLGAPMPVEKLSGGVPARGGSGAFEAL